MGLSKHWRSTISNFPGYCGNLRQNEPNNSCLFILHVGFCGAVRVVELIHAESLGLEELRCSHGQINRQIMINQQICVSMIIIVNTNVPSECQDTCT